MKPFRKIFLYPLLAVLTVLNIGWKENFTTLGKDGVPVGWEYKDGPFGVSDLQFSIVTAPGSEDNKVLRIDSNAASGVIVTDAYRGVDLTKTPVMYWRWRVVKPTTATREDDQAVVVYFGAIDWLKKKSVGYRWETLIPVGTTGYTSYGAGLVQVHYYVLRDDKTPVGEWVEDYRNVREEFQAAYGYVPQEFAVSIGANSQYTRSHSIAEIDYIEFLTPEEAEKRRAEAAAAENTAAEEPAAESAPESKES